MEDVTVLDFLLSQDDSVWYQILFRSPQRCDRCGEVFYDIDNEYSIYGNVGKLRHGSEIAKQYDGIYETSIEKDKDVFITHGVIFILIESDLLDYDRDSKRFKSYLFNDLYLCRDCKHGNYYPPEYKSFYEEIFTSDKSDLQAD